MATASFYGVVKTILILLLVYYALKFLIRLFAPVIIQQVVKKAEQKLNDLQQQQYNQQQAHANTADKPREKKKVGEYIDYEEID